MKAVYKGQVPFESSLKLFQGESASSCLACWEMSLSHEAETVTGSVSIHTIAVVTDCCCDKIISYPAPSFLTSAPGHSIKLYV